MSTNSAIIEQLPDGTYRGVYCHWDGYPQFPGVGAQLLRFYNTPLKVKKLINKGHLSSIQEDGQVNTDGSKEIWTAKNVRGITSKMFADYFYVWKDNQWYCNSRKFSHKRAFKVKF